MRFCLRVLLLSALSGTVAPLHAETHFVSGTCDGLRTYAIVSRNGIEFRTDQLGPRVNAGIWAELTTADRKALIRAYGWDLGSRTDHFGSTTSGQMAVWINQEQGWTAAVDALEARHASKAFPTLTPVFGPGAVLELPVLYCANPEIINSPDYKEASRLALEIRLDYDVGKQLYDMLTQAKWDQVSVAVKGISGPLIQIIVDNFMTGFITHGATGAYSELQAAFELQLKDLRDYIRNLQKPGAPPPTPPELIQRLEIHIAVMEHAAENAVTLVAQKKSRLSDLATKLKQLDAAKTDEKKNAATAVRDSLTTRASTLPGAAGVPTFLPSDPTAPLDQRNASVAAQAAAYLRTNVINPKATLESDKGAAVAAVVDKYGQVINNAGLVAYPGRSYAPDASDGFSRPYFEVKDTLHDVQGWLATDIPTAITSMNTYKTTLATAPAGVNSVLDSSLPRINSLQSLALGMDKYQGVLGYKPSETISFASLRDFSAIVNIAATPDKKVEDLVTELTDQTAVADEIKGALPTGIDKRKAWINSEWSHYDSLRFNFENSLSYVIAGLKQIDRLHSGPTFKKDPIPWTCYGSACLYVYTVDVDGIRARVASNATAAARETARVQAVDELLRLRAEEAHIIHRLEIAQNSHLDDALEMRNFFEGIAARYQYANLNTITQEFESVTGKTMKSQGDLSNNLLPDITYYYLGSPQSGGWIRNSGNLATFWYDLFHPVGSPIELVSGKISEYYELLNLYRSMEVNKSQYLGMTVTQFDAFMTDTTLKIGSSPTGSYINAFQIAGVWGVEWPAWQLVMKTQWRRESLNSEYRHYGTMSPVAWDVSGFVGTPGSLGNSQAPAASLAVAPDALTGVGAPGVTVLLNGYLTTSTKTASDGSFLFEWIGSGNFALSVSGQGYQFPAPSTQLTVAQQNSTANFTVVETADSGYSISGKATDASGSALQGIAIALMSAAGDAQTVVTGADGVYRFFHVTAGSWTISPVGGEWTFSPATRTATVPLSAAGLDFVGTAGVTGAEGVSVTLSGTGGGGVTSTPAGITCPGVCWAAFPTGTSVTLTATSQTGSVLAAWYGRCAGNTACTVPVSGAASVIAVFNSTAPPDGVAPTITAFTLPASSTSLTVPLSFTAIDNVAVTGYLATTDTETPAPTDPRWQPSAPASHTFSGSGLQILFGWAKDAAGNISEAQSATVSLTLICYGLTTGVSPVWVGSVSVNTGQNCTGGYTLSSGISLMANTPAGYTFTDWSGTGGSFSSTTANPTTFTITGDATVTAAFGTLPGTPSITGIAPRVGPASGGTLVTLTGTGFQAGATITIGGTAAGSVSFVSVPTSLTATTPAHPVGPADVAVTNPGGAASLVLPGGFLYTASGAAPRSYTIVPCRILDTRNPNGPFGGPPLAAGSLRSFSIPSGSCSIPADAAAVVLNVTIADATDPGTLTIFPGSGSIPGTNTISFVPGKNRANNVVLGLVGGVMTVKNFQSTGTVNLIVDVNGYFQ